MYSAPPCTLFVSSPLIEDFIQNFVIGLFTNQEIAIGNKQTVGRFTISQVESIAAPDFSENQNFKCLSPFVLSTMKMKNDKLMPHYYRPDDPELAEAIRQNLIQKHQTVYKKLPENQNLNFQLDRNYVERKGGLGKITKLITIKESNEKEQTKIKAIYSPFNLSGSPELNQIAWEAGVGNYCSLGFEMIDVVKQRVRHNKSIRR
jgi:CRISPR-associated endoribonuclease Cas6